MPARGARDEAKRLGFPTYVVPMTRGGTNDPENICCACGDCNLRKGVLTAKEYLALLDAAEAA